MIIERRSYLASNSKQDVEQRYGRHDSYDNFGVVIPDRRPESQNQDRTREAERYHDGAPPHPLVRENPKNLVWETTTVHFKISVSFYIFYKTPKSFKREK